MANKKPPEFDRRTLAYKQAAAERGDLVLEPAVETFAELIYESGYRGTVDRSYWVPTSEIRGVVHSEFESAPHLTARQIGQAIRAAEPEAIRVYRRPSLNAKPVHGFAGITGPSGIRTK